MNARTMNVVCVINHDERHIFLFDDESSHKALVVAAQWAGNPDLKFNWYDAALVAKQVAKFNENRRREREFYERLAQ